MMNYDLIIFDFDGTVLNTKKAIIHSLLSTTLNATERVDREQILGEINRLIAVGTTLEDVLVKLGISRKNLHEAIIAYRQFYASEGQEKCEIFEGTLETLHSLREQKIPLALLSNKGEAALKRDVEHFGLREYFMEILGEREGVKPKPDPSVFQTVISAQFQLQSSSQVLMIGDTTTDLEFAKNIGADSCFVTYGFGERETCCAMQPTFIVDSIQSLLSILQRI